MGKMGSAAIFTGTTMANVRCGSSDELLTKCSDRAFFSRTLQEMQFGEGIPPARDQCKQFSRNVSFVRRCRRSVSRARALADQDAVQPLTGMPEVR